MQMLDSGEADDKIIAVAADDIGINHINDINQLPQHLLREVKSFFEDYKKLEHKTVKVEDFLGKELAYDIISQAITDYQQNFPAS